LDTLSSDQELQERGYSFFTMGGVLVEREGHARGIWRCTGNGFSWTPAGYNEPIHWVADADAAASYTLKLLSAR
jgi:hypothetical protein